MKMAEQPINEEDENDRSDDADEDNTKDHLPGVIGSPEEIQRAD